MTKDPRTIVFSGHFDFFIKRILEGNFLQHVIKIIYNFPNTSYDFVDFC